jgi:hypothetical protein
LASKQIDPRAISAAQVGEEDYNQDGKPELIRFTATAQSRYPVNSFKLLLQFSYTLQVSVTQCVLSFKARWLIWPVRQACGGARAPAAAQELLALAP